MLQQQILDKNFDKVILGRNILGVILGLTWPKRDEKTLIIGHEKSSLGHGFIDKLSNLELVFFKLLGSQQNIEIFKNLNQQVEKSPFYLIVDNKRVLLGNSYNANLRELYRKFKEFAPLYYWGLENASILEENIQKITNRLVHHLYHFYDVDSFDMGKFLMELAPDFRIAFTNFCEIYRYCQNDPNSICLRTLFLGLKVHYQHQVEGELSQLELFTLFLMILSPSYKLDFTKLINELEAIYKERGGILKTTAIREWKFYKNSPWALELASYEGIIHPRKVAIVGLDLLDEYLPVALAYHQDGFRAFEIRANLNEGIYGTPPFLKKPMMVIFSKKIGTSRPFCYIRQTESQMGSSIVCTMAVLVQIGFKKSFITRDLKNDFMDILKHMLPSIGDQSLALDISEVAEFWPSANRGNRGKKKSASQYKKNRNIFYHGPLKPNKLGMLTTLLGIK